MAWVYHCNMMDTTGRDPVCVDGDWTLVEESGGMLLPDLPISDAMEIGSAIALVWIIGFLWREIRRAVTSIDRDDK